MHQEDSELRRLLLNEAVRREAYAYELAEIAAQNSNTVFGPALHLQVQNQRIRALELWGQAGALAEWYGEPHP